MVFVLWANDSPETTPAGPKPRLKTMKMRRVKVIHHAIMTARMSRVGDQSNTQGQSMMTGDARGCLSQSKAMWM